MTARGKTAAAAILVAVAVSACASSVRLAPQTKPSPPAHVAGGRPAHIAIVVMENEEYADIVGSTSTPYINQLAARYGLATQMYAIRHPSLPNYFALTGGSTFGFDDDCTNCAVPGAGLAGQLHSVGLSWKAYMEDMPSACFTGADAGGYAKKHDPFVYYDGISGNPSLCANVVPFSALARDEASHALPAFIWITPNLCHDMHDCDPAVGDRFLSRTIPPLLRALGPRGLLLLTWDEGSSDNGCCRLASGGHVATIVAGALARARARLGTATDHYSVLQTIEDLLRLPRIGGAACACTPSLAPLLRSGPTRRSAAK
jgi:hypothetical protein